MRIPVLALLTCALASLCTSVAEAQVVTTWDLSVTQRYNYASGSYDAFTPITGTLVISFPNFVASATDYGTSTITRFGGLLDTTFASPVTSLVGVSPYGAPSTSTSYTFPNVSDFGSSFLEEFAAQANTYNRDAATSRSWSYHIELRATIRSASRGGTGAADYAFTPTTVLEWLNAFQAGGGEANFSEYFSWYDEPATSYLGGYSWSGTATLRSVASAIPEPAGVAAALGLAALGVVLVRRFNFNGPKQKTNEHPNHC